MHVDFLIIGQGLAGSVLAWTLMRRGCRVLVVDDGSKNASQVAAGIVNPISGLRMAKTAEIDRQLPVAIDCYRQLSITLGQQFYFEKPIFRLFQSESEREHALKREQNPDYAAYIERISPLNQPLHGFNVPFGFMAQQQSGHLMTASLLRCLKDFFIRSDAYRRTIVAYDSFQIDTKVTWQDVSAKQVIFCEGYRLLNNPWFNKLPLQPVKGEIATLNQPHSLPEAIMNYGHWLLPSSNGQFRVGATFERFQTGLHITGPATSALLKTLATVHPGLATAPVIDRNAGIRPCTSDRKPIIGRHPKHNRLSVFNGFGAKGSLQIPFYSELFADFLLLNRPLPAACALQRFEPSRIAR